LNFGNFLKFLLHFSQSGKDIPDHLPRFRCISRECRDILHFFLSSYRQCWECWTRINFVVVVVVVQVAPKVAPVVITPSSTPENVEIQILDTSCTFYCVFVCLKNRFIISLSLTHSLTHIPCRDVIGTAAKEDEVQLENDMKKADVICIVYAVNDPATKESIQTRWLPQIRRLGLNVHNSLKLKFTDQIFIQRVDNQSWSLFFCHNFLSLSLLLNRSPLCWSETNSILQLLNVLSMTSVVNWNPSWINTVYGFLSSFLSLSLSLYVVS
jgi:hypothetical protein